ncbi:DUF5719 family protein [Nocardioides sp. cx-173]|uniref:DUF5719 family protein n=1 Tax=Nocardioides sp. cx-173 TaxID=2898796 RepID=UPI001E348E03|nr:DUF5719 family protein [Nocardioides sp. cx-173]MCD4525342.1 DUF5719 family protein [Nocardioides sp. cx-173]UGB40861.1 DUF5719 family protein [Nocardioides sp. cx-173]
MSAPGNQSGNHSGNQSGRSRGRRLDVTTVLAVVLPLLTAATLLAVRPDAAEPSTRPPAQTSLSRTVVVCPGGSREVRVASGTDAGGTTPYTVGDTGGQAEVRPGRVTTLTTGPGPFIARPEGALAAGLVAARFDQPLAAAECRAPAPDLWFTGLGAGARHTSVLELVNPDGGPAIVDATLYGVAGVVDAPELRGVAVPPRGVVRLDLGALVPRRDELAVHVTTARGRVAASVRDRQQELGTGGAADDWLPAQAAPATSNLLLGVTPGKGLHNLVLLNPGEDETRATVRLVSPSAVFSPAGLEEVVLPPRSVTRVSLAQVLTGKAAKGVSGLLVEAPDPITATLRSYVRRDLSHAVAGTPLTSPATVVAPAGDKRLELAGATRAGAVAVTARAANGTVLAEETIEVQPGRGFGLDLPPATALLTVSPERTEVTGALVVTEGTRVAVLRLRELVTSSLVGDVRPGLP